MHTRYGQIIVLALVALGVVLLATACGGGGGGY
jgi:hypothetical protein